MSAQSIAAEVEAAYREVAQEVGDGPFTVTLIEPATQPENPWDAATGSDTEHTDIPALASTVPDEWIDGTLVRADDEMIQIAGTAPEPQQSWRVRMGGNEYTIQMIKTVKPAGEALYHGLVLRR